MPQVPKLERLVLRRCGIRTVSMDAFYALFALQELDLSFNQLQALPPSLLDQQSHLRELRLSGNQLKELPPAFLDLVPAKMIRLDDNPWDCSCDMASWNPAATNKVRRLYSRLQRLSMANMGMTCQQFKAGLGFPWR